MEILWVILIGLLAGALARLLMPGRDPAGILVTMALGLGGSLVANVFGEAVGWYEDGRGAGIAASILGAILVLFIHRLVRDRKADPSRT